MAIKDQCSQCKSFHEGLCKLQSSLPVYDQTSCSQYIKKGINLDKYEGQVSHNNTFENGDTPPSNQTDIHGKQRMFQHPFSFKGRIRRLEYGLSYLLIYVLFLPINITPENQVSEGMAIFYFILFFPALWFMWAQGAKRCHDRGNSGWYQLIPFYGLWMLFGDGEECDNEYGSDPKGRSTFS